MHSENNGTKVWSITCLFGREYKFTPWSLQYSQSSNHYNSIKQAIFQSTIQATSHKIIETKQCMQACQTLFYLQKWFIIGYNHSKTLIGHFIKW